MSIKAVFREQGYFLTQAADPRTTEAVNAARDRALELAVDPTTAEKRNWTLRDGTFKHHMNPHLTEPAFRRLLESPGIVECVRGILGARPACITHSKISYKFAGKRHYWYPHQDAGYKSKLRKGFAIAVYLDDCHAQNGTLEFYPGSHKLGLIRHRRQPNRHENLHQAVLDATVDIQPQFMEGATGAILCFDLLMVHSSRENRSGGCRPIFIFEVEPFRLFPTADTGDNGLVVNGKAFAPCLWLGPRVHRLSQSLQAMRNRIRTEQTWAGKTRVLCQHLVG